MRNYTFDEAVTLVAVDEKTGAETRRESYADICSVRREEDYQAMSVGLKPEMMVVLPNWDDDYHGEKMVEYNSKPYRILRAFKTEDLRAELTVYRLRAGVSESGTNQLGG